MVPASIARPAAGSIGQVSDVGSVPVGWRRANVPFAVRAGLHSLSVWGVVVGLLSVILLLGYVWVRLKVVEAGYRLAATRQLVEVLEEEGRELDVRAAAAETEARLQELARVRLGMREPTRQEQEPLP
jgi:cell division protein FtsL